MIRPDAQPEPFPAGSQPSPAPTGCRAEPGERADEWAKAKPSRAPAAEPLTADRGRVADVRLLASIALGKVGVLLLIFMAYNLLPFFRGNFDVNFVDPLHPEVSLASAFSTWDAQHYLYLSEAGYHPDQISDAFFPLLPLLIHVATPLFHSSLAAGLVVSNLASLAGLYLLFKLVAEQYGARAARGTLLLYLAFPTAFFLSLIYTESLFLVLTAAFFYLLFSGRFAWAALPAALLPLARPEGVLIILPFVVYYGLERLGIGRRPVLEALDRLRAADVAAVLSPVVGGVAYLTFMRLATGNAFEMFQAMHSYVSAHSLTYVLHPVQLAQALWQWPLALHGFTNSIVDRALFLLFLALLVPMFRRLHPSLALFALAVGLLNVLSGTFMSYSRYLLLAFPVFITAALLLERPNLRSLRMPLAYCMVLIQGLFLVMHALSYWVA